MPLSKREIRRLSNRVRLRKALAPPPLRKPLKTVFDDLGLVFVHIPKTAGTSVRRGLATLPRTRERLYPRLKTHARAFEYRIALGEKRWKRYFSFAVVRNPFDLMLSSYFWWCEKACHFRRLEPLSRRVQSMTGFPEFIRSDLGSSHINEYRGDLFDWISLDGEIIIDYVARFETLADDWHTVCQQIGVSPFELPRVNATSRGDYRHYYDDDSVERVASRFRRTIDYFGYRF